MKPSAEISVFFDLKVEWFLLLAVCSFLSNITLSLSMLNLLDLKSTFFFNNILSLSTKLPSLAVTEIFWFKLLIENLGAVISTLETMLLFTITLENEIEKYFEKIIIKKIIEINNEKNKI